MKPKKSNVRGPVEFWSAGSESATSAGWNRTTRRLLGVDRQAVLAHPLGQDLHDPPGVVSRATPITKSSAKELSKNNLNTLS